MAEKSPGSFRWKGVNREVLLSIAERTLQNQRDIAANGFAVGKRFLLWNGLLLSFAVNVSDVVMNDLVEIGQTLGAMADVLQF